MISSRLYGLMSVREAFHSWSGAHRSMLRPARSGAEHRVCVHKTAPGPGVCYITLPESTEVHSINNHVVFAEHCGRSAVAASSVRVSTAPLVLVARDENGQRC